MTPGSSMLAMILGLPPQRAQLSISMPNTRTQKSPGVTARAFRIRLRKKEAPLARGFFVLPQPQHWHLYPFCLVTACCLSAISPRLLPLGSAR